MNSILRKSLASILCMTSLVINAAENSNHAVSSLSEKLSIGVATWNVEHLAFPTELGCKPRNNQEVVKLREYAQSIDADVIALQEVSSYQAVEKIFPDSDWQILVSQRPDSESYECRGSGNASTQQKVAFAVRQNIEVKNVENFAALGLENPGLRHGLELTINTELGPIVLLNVHMKSGCFVDNYSRSDKSACIELAKQAPILDRWIEARETQGTPYIVLGDFNHRLSAPYNHLTRQLKNNSDHSTSSLDITTKDLIGCHPYYPAPIDHIVVGNLPNDTYQRQVKVYPFQDMEPKAMLSDHCAISLQLDKKQRELSPALQWQTRSAEYQFLVRSLYQGATQVLAQQAEKAVSNWSVVMDIDETVLDNSGYQIDLERSGRSYSPESWSDWVVAQKAKLVPGAKYFVESVIKHGGKLVLVTNRKRELDQYTWRNLVELGLPVSSENTCLIGRDIQDKASLKRQDIHNDKDLRRMQVQNGTASCYQANSSSRHNNFPPLQILMQVGDNIEDFSGVTQEYADIEALLGNDSETLILLPNPMYGSW